MSYGVDPTSDDHKEFKFGYSFWSDLDAGSVIYTHARALLTD